MLTSDIWGDILRFVVKAVPRQHNNEKEIQKDFVAVVLSGNSDILSCPLSFVNNFFKNFFVLKNFRFSRQVFILPHLPDICQQLF